MRAAVDIDKIAIIYHTLQCETLAVSDCSFSVATGEFVAIVGPSGCGKSTLLSAICGLVTPCEGRIDIFGETVTGQSDNVAYMLQRDYLFDWRTILRNACLGLEVKKQDTPENIQRVHTMLEQYGLGKYKDRYPRELSGGMRQKAALIRTLALNPDILLLDEPFSALDYQTRLAVSGEISDIIRERKKTALLVTHDISEAVSMSDRVIVLSRRPASVKLELTLDELTGENPIERRKDPHFREYFNQIWKELDVHVE